LEKEFSVLSAAVPGCGIGRPPDPNKLILTGAHKHAVCPHYNLVPSSRPEFVEETEVLLNYP